MSRHRWVCVGSLALLLCMQSVASSHRFYERYPQPVQELQGFWKVVSYEHNGQMQTPAGQRWKITKDQIIFFHGVSEGGRWNYRFPDGIPMGIDIAGSTTPQLVMPTIYEVRGDLLRFNICQFLTKGTRATEFRTQKDGIHVCYHLKRHQE